MAGALQGLGSWSSRAQPAPELMDFLPEDLQLKDSTCSSAGTGSAGSPGGWGMFFPASFSSWQLPFVRDRGDYWDLVPSFSSGFRSLRVFLCLMWRDTFWVSVFLKKPLGLSLACSYLSWVGLASSCNS